MLTNYESAQWGVVQTLAGRPAEARRMLAEFDSMRKERYVAADAYAAIHAALGETDSAFAVLDRSMAEGSLGPVVEMVEPNVAAPVPGSALGPTCWCGSTRRPRC